MTKSYSNLRSLLFVCAVFLLSSFYSFSAFGQCNSVVADQTFNSVDSGFGQGQGTYPYDLNRGNPFLHAAALQNDDRLLFPTPSYNRVPTKPLIRTNSDGSLDNTFDYQDNYGINSYDIATVELQDDGKILVGYSTPNNVYNFYHRIARFNIDGSVDSSFTLERVYGTNISVPSIYQIKYLPNGKILIGGVFSAYGNDSRNGIALLNSDGSLDSSFNHGIPLSKQFRRFEVQQDGKIIIAVGQNNFSSSDQVYRLESDGSIDNTFSAPYSHYEVYKIKSLSNSQIMIGGYKTIVNNGRTASLTRLNNDGSIDTSFDTGTGFEGSALVSNGISDILELPSGNTLVVGMFRKYNGVDVSGGFADRYSNIIKLNTDGTLDSSFDGGGNMLSFIRMRSDGKFLSGIGLKEYKRKTVSAVVLLNNDGSLNLDYNRGTGATMGSVRKVEYQGNDKIIIAGDFGVYNGVPTKSIARLNLNGSLDQSFALFEGVCDGVRRIDDVLVLNDNKIFVVGYFENACTSPTISKFLKLNSDGSIDQTYTPIQYNSSSYPTDLDMQSNGKLIIGGSGQYHGILRLNTDGTLDMQFFNNNYGGGTNINIKHSLVQSDDKIVIIGNFNEFNSLPFTNLLRLNADGSIDNSFLDIPQIYNNIYMGALQSDDKIITALNTPVGLARLNADGSIDNTFDPGLGFETNTYANTQIFSMKCLDDGKIILSGNFTKYNGITVGKTIRLNSNGSLDTSFDGDGSIESRIVDILQTDVEEYIVVGYFGEIEGIGKNSVAKIKNISSYTINNTTPPNQQHGVCANTTTTLQMTQQGVVYWYNSPTSTTPIHTGDSFTTPTLTADSTYFYALDSIVGCGSSNRLEVLVTTLQTLNAVSQINYTTYLDNTGNIEVDATLLDSISSAGCGNTIDSYLFDDTGLATRSFSCADTNVVHNVVLRVTDSNGNVETSPTIIQVKDTIRPVVSVRTLPVLFNVSNQATISARDFITSLSDNCTDSVDINVVFNDTGLETKIFDCGNSSVRSLNLQITDRSGNQVIQPVIINPSATNHDFNVNIIANTFRPAIASNITVFANNYSCAPKSGELKVTLPNDITYNSASIAPDRIVGSNLFWNVTDLNYDRNFVVRVSVTPDISLNIGDEVCFSGHITPEVNDLTRLNNLKQYCFPIVNSYDPNDKQVYPQGICDEKFTKRSDLPLTYTIRFQNTGNAPAIDVNIVDSLSNLLNRRSLRVVGSSHAMTVDTTANNNVINFVFNNINLPDSTTSPELSQGYVIFELDEIAAHTDTSRIENKSYIYFDTNAPIITNTVKNTIVDVLPQCNPTTPNPPIADCTLPTNLSTEILTSTRVKLSWTTPSNTNAVNYEVLRNGQRLATIPASNLSYVDSTLTANTQYNYSIKAICGNNTATSNSVQVRTLPATPTLLSVIAACKGERGTINVQSAGATYRVYDSETASTPLFETNNASIETPVLNDSTTFYISVVINGQESQRLEAVVPIKEVFEATIEQGTLLESCATEFVLSAQEVEGATYTWFRENVQVGTERTLTTTFEARYKVRVIKNDCSDESEFTTTRFVDAPTARIEQGNSVSFCGSGTLNAQDTSANVVYEWTLNGSNVGNGTSISVSESGTYTLKASQPSCADSVTIAVTITTAPTNVELTASKTAICTSEETLLSATTGTSFTYKWFRNNTVISNTSASLSTSEIGTYKVEITTAEGCKVETSEVEITRLQVNPAIIRINTENGKDKTIDVSSQDAIDSVMWFKDGVAIPSFANQILITPTETGNYKAQVVYETGCSFETAEKTFTVDGITGIEEESTKIFTIYPNPNNGSFKVEFATTTNQKTNLVLVDGLGRIIHSQEIAMNEKTLSITLPKISAGVYVVQIISEGKVYTKQLVIQ
ncbi:T9SS type A sorting domain-containing protein [Bernardetia sp. OM2101]|uniref:DUF7619 domain-containing protein n=1 Tax=Bernardetia sp. OM2101 TaxID=3344876 RepID=UPI0035D05922